MVGCRKSLVPYPSQDVPKRLRLTPRIVEISSLLSLPDLSVSMPGWKTCAQYAIQIIHTRLAQHAMHVGPQGDNMNLASVSYASTCQHHEVDRMIGSA